MGHHLEYAQNKVAALEQRIMGGFQLTRLSLMIDDMTHVRVVGAFQALLVSRRTLLTPLVHRMLWQPLALLRVHGSHRRGSGADHPGGGHARRAAGSGV